MPKRLVTPKVASGFAAPRPLVGARIPVASPGIPPGLIPEAGCPLALPVPVPVPPVPLVVVPVLGKVVPPPRLVP